MTERLLQFIWQHQYFNRADLRLEDGAALQIIHPGKNNTHQGPDFTAAVIRIDQTTLVGNIELHIKSSDYFRHGHEGDRNYRNMILHVVWQHDDTAKTLQVPTLELQQRVPVMLLQQYNRWMEQPASIPCGSLSKHVGDLIWTGWKESLLARRLERRSHQVLQLLQDNKMHWEDTCWQLLARSFGTQVNANAFETIARHLPLAIMHRHKNQLPVLEALLMGQAGLLNDQFIDDYSLLLQREFLFLRYKYALPAPAVQVHFLRMRPANFPSIRLSQLAMLLYRTPHLFAAIREATAVGEIETLLRVEANDYWHYHYRLDEPSAYSVKFVGDDMVTGIIVNTVAPLLFAYAVYRKESVWKDKALEWLMGMSAEKNTILRGWSAIGISARNAAESQALIELRTQYCDQRKCLDCAIGNALLKTARCL